MKQLFVFLLTTILFGCQNKNSQQTQIVPVSSGLAGTYSKTYNPNEHALFRQIFSDYNTFQETATVVITQTATDDYKLEVILYGTAKKEKAPDIHYGVTAELKRVKGFNMDGTPALMFQGNFDNLVPHSSDINGTLVGSEIKIKERSIEFFLGVNYKKDAGILIGTNLPKIK
jgi:hypothetical protein